MKNIKLIIISFCLLFAFKQVNAQLDATFYVQDSCMNFYMYASTSGYSYYYYEYGDGNSDTITNQWGEVNYVYNSPGTYTISLTVSDNGQSATETQTITVLPNNQVSFTYNNQSSCNLPVTYNFVSQQSNPNNPIVFWEWHVGGQYLGDSSNLNYSFNTAGTYDVILYGHNTNGCFSEWIETIVITQSNLSASISHQVINSSCNGSIVDLYSTVSGGTAPYTYSWSDNTGNVYTTSNPQQVLITPNSGGIIELQVIDAAGCSITISDTVPTPQSGITAFSSNTPTSGCGQTCDGTIDAVATGTTGSYTFILNPGNQTQIGNQVSFTNLCQGSYQIEVIDQNQCSTVLFEYIDQDSSSQIIVDAILNNGNACDTFTCNASAEIIASNGVAPYQFSLDGGITYQSNSIFDSLCPNTYQVLAQDANGCTGFYTFTIGAQSLGAQNNSYYASCDSNTQGNTSFIQVYPYGGQPPYSFSWSDGSTTSSINNPTPNTNYTVIITDANGCTFAESFNVPDNNCYTITGNVYVDVNNNCIYDSTDYPIQAFVDLTATAGGPWLWNYDYTDANGAFEITTNAGNYFFDVNGTNVNGLTMICPNSTFSVNLDANNPNPTVDFFFQAPPPSQDLSINMYTPYTFTPGFPTYTSVQYCNDGTITMSGSVVVEYDPALVWYQSGVTPSGHNINNNSVPTTHDAANHTLTYNFSNLQPGQCVHLDIDYETPINTGLMPGDPIVIDATVNPIAGDLTPNNNVTYLARQIVSSWDPNDKAVFPDGDITIDDNDHNYYIRFQNEGNGNATTIVVRDELDINLDLRSLRNVNASHDYILTIENDNELVFTFNNIQLPPKSVNEPASQGFVAFSISQNGDLPVGTEIENTAAIYFDFNPAIITNTVLNTIVEKTTAISDIEIENAVSIYPNPSEGLYNINISNNLEATNVKVYDVLGNVILVMPHIKSNQLQVNLQNNNNGIYFIEITTSKGTTFQKLVKNNK